MTSFVPPSLLGRESSARSRSPSFGGAVVGYLPAFWSEHLGGFITIAEREE
ncbi:MAG: hypothetical protein M5U22_07225 [Thermoleophilia bacterium]|nr:hypothetical protein [Thermoleophilia bacterium]